MPEPFKNLINKRLITGMSRHFYRAWLRFDQSTFIRLASKNLDDLELKERLAAITMAMAAHLPQDFEKAARIMRDSLAPDDGSNLNSEINNRGIVGWAVLPMADYVGQYGIDHFDLSMHLLKEMTKRSSSEFAIRTFLAVKQRHTLSVLTKWVNDKNYHVRRLVSEGTRPRLPWATRLPAFIEDPAPVIELLEKLKDDPEEYVRRSVANNLNDISKDHPELVERIAIRWLKGASKNRAKLVRHACRTLIKQGRKKTLKAFGYGPPLIKLQRLSILTPRVRFGKTLQFEVSLRSSSNKIQSLIIDYAIDHRKANGGSSPKVFKWKNTKLKPMATITANKNHSIRKITTRVYYPGEHGLEIFINGVSFGRKTFELVM